MLIESKDDLLYYLEADRLGMKKFNNRKPRFLLDEHWRYTVILRKIEYLTNCKKGLLWKTILYLYKFRLYRLSIKTGISIYHNSFGPGLALFHHGTIVVNPTAKIGRDCQIYCGTNIASNVVIGDKVFIAPGVVISDGVTIGDGVRIGANSVVTKSILQNNITVAGAPAIKVSNKGTDSHYVGGTERVRENYPSQTLR